MDSSHSVFLIGAGYIGHPILDQLIAAGYQVTTLVRRPEQAEMLRRCGSTTVTGTLKDLDLLTEQTSQHEVTINTSSSDDLSSVQAILEGVRRRALKRQPTIFIHTSGTGELEDGALGMHQNPKIYHDDEPGEMNTIPATAMHRQVDNAILTAANEMRDKAKIVITMPPLVYGFDKSHGRRSFVLDSLVKFTLKRGWAGYVGDGKNVWSAVHIHDLARAYMTLLSYVINAESGKLQDNPWFFAENGTENSGREWAENVARILFQMGKVEKNEVRSWSNDDYGDVLGPLTPRGFGCNSRCRARRLREVGWECKEKGIWVSWKEDEIPSIVAAA